MGAIVGPVVAVVVVALLAALFVVHRRRRRAFLSFAQNYSPTTSDGNGEGPAERGKGQMRAFPSL